jgi:hypothetical protein
MNGSTKKTENFSYFLVFFSFNWYEFKKNGKRTETMVKEFGENIGGRKTKEKKLEIKKMEKNEEKMRNEEKNSCSFFAFSFF